VAAQLNTPIDSLRERPALRAPKEQTLPGNLSGTSTAAGRHLWKATWTCRSTDGASCPAQRNSQVHEQSGEVRTSTIGLLMTLALATPLWLAVLGIVVNALVGALRGYDDARHWDVVGVTTFALLMGLGGGLIRDVLLGELPPLSLRTPWPIATVLATVAVARVVGGWLRRVPLLLASLDALALGLFTMSGAAAAAAHGLPAVSAGLVGTLSAVGGGVMVSVLRGEVPGILQPGRPVALLSVCVAVVYLGLARWDANGAYLAGAVVSVAVFLLALRLEVTTASLAAATSPPVDEWRS
jgi:uncharacterized membrane protein YeiH